MNEETKSVVTAIGALAEMCGLLKKQLIKNGFTEKQAMSLIGKYLSATVTPNRNKEDF